MWWLYLDESGDLGFDFVNKRPSRFFTICILATNSLTSEKKFRYAVKKTLKRKINHRRRTPVAELHAYDSSPSVKQYTCNLLKDAFFSVYAVTLDKQRALAYASATKVHIYNHIARQVVDRIPLEEDAAGNVLLTVDRSQGAADRYRFNTCIEAQLEGRLDPSVRLDITHADSASSPGLQLADMFAWAIHRSYEYLDDTFVELFRGKVEYDELAM